jgi:hypothetical protein
MIINNQKVTEKVKTICELLGKKQANSLISVSTASQVISNLKSFVWEAKINVDVDSVKLYEAKYRIANLKKTV